MVLAAGRGERMRPLTDRCPKPLLKVADKSLIEWQVERLVRAGFIDIVINHAYLGAMIEAALGNGSRYGARIQYSPEAEPLETAGGIAQALPLLGNEPFLTVSADIFTDFDYAGLVPKLKAMAQRPDETWAYLVMTPNPAYHTRGDFVLDGGRITLGDGPRLNYGNIGLHQPALFAGLPRGVKMPLLPLWKQAIAAGKAYGEYFAGCWVNVGTPQQLAELDARYEKSEHHD